MIPPLIVNTTVSPPPEWNADVDGLRINEDGGIEDLRELEKKGFII